MKTNVHRLPPSKRGFRIYLYDAIAEALRHAPDEQASPKQVIAYIDRWYGHRDWSHSSIRTYLNKMSKEQRIVRYRRGVYSNRSQLTLKRSA